MAGYEWHDLVGNVGVLLILATYFAIQVDRIDVTGYLYITLNGLGAGFILVSLLYDFNLSAFIIELAWLCISLFGLARRWNIARSGQS